MRRREFMTLLGGAAVAWPMPVGAQQEAKNRKVGVLHPGRGVGLDARITAINEGLNDPSQRFRTELVVILAYGELSRLPLLASDLVNDRVDAIVAVGPPAVQATKDATANIPVIAIDLESDPVASGWIESLARPRSNVTGVFGFSRFRCKMFTTTQGSSSKPFWNWRSMGPDDGVIAARCRPSCRTRHGY
jgi:ABC-type uncharacterized transport system substrate-binding protein